MTGHWSNDASAFASLLDRAAATMRASPYRDGSVVRLPRRGRLLVTGDLHDSLDGLERAMRLARLEEGPDHGIVLHELIHSERTGDGVDRSHRMLAVVAELILEHPLQVHPILANHEIAQCRRQRISKSGVDSVARFDAGLEWAFGDDADIAADAVAAFVLAMPLAILCDNGLMVSHSLPPGSSMQWFDPRILERAIFDEDLDAPDGAAYLMTWGRDHSPAQLVLLAREWGVRTFVVGHTHVPQGIATRLPNLVIINSDHAAARALSVDLVRDIPTAMDLAATAIPLFESESEGVRSLSDDRSGEADRTDPHH